VLRGEVRDALAILRDAHLALARKRALAVIDRHLVLLQQVLHAARQLPATARDRFTTLAKS
jgi:hypothetical protein